MAKSIDGLIEAIRLKNKKFVWAIQWHPEFSYKVNDDSVLLIKEFIKNC